MQLALTPEEAAFRDELRTIYTTKIPQEIRDRVRKGSAEVNHDDIVASHKILHEHGLAVPNWPVEWGGKEWTPTQQQIWADEMQLACVPEPLNFNTKMVGPVIAEFGSEEVKQRFLPPTASLDIWWCQGFRSRKPVRTWPRCAPPRCATATATSSTAKDLDHPRSVRGLDLLSGAHRPAGAQTSGRHLVPVVRDELTGVTLRPIKTIDGGHEVNEVFSKTSGYPPISLSEKKTRAGRTRSSCWATSAPASPGWAGPRCA